MSKRQHLLLVVWKSAVRNASETFQAANRTRATVLERNPLNLTMFHQQVMHGDDQGFVTVETLWHRELPHDAPRADCLVSLQDQIARVHPIEPLQWELSAVQQVSIDFFRSRCHCAWYIMKLMSRSWVTQLHASWCAGRTLPPRRHRVAAKRASPSSVADISLAKASMPSLMRSNALCSDALCQSNCDGRGQRPSTHNYPGGQTLSPDSGDVPLPLPHHPPAAPLAASNVPTTLGVTSLQAQHDRAPRSPICPRQQQTKVHREKHMAQRRPRCALIFAARSAPMSCVSVSICRQTSLRLFFHFFWERQRRALV